MESVQFDEIPQKTFRTNTKQQPTFVRMLMKVGIKSPAQANMILLVTALLLIALSFILFLYRDQIAGVKTFNTPAELKAYLENQKHQPKNK